MNATGIRPGDIVEVDIRGQRGFALVKRGAHRSETLGKRVLQVTPLPHGPHKEMWLPGNHPTPRQIVGHWRKARGQQKRRFE